MTMIRQASPLILSVLMHFGVVLFVALTFVISRMQRQTIDVNVIVMDKPVLAPQADIDLTKARPDPPPAQPEVRKVFGSTRDSLKASDNAPGVEVKAGNTVATVPDNEVLRDDDPNRVPIPVEEYLISSPPQLLESFKPQYPREARDRNIEGAVRVEILIDRQGAVRDAKVIQGLGYGTEEAALEAARRLRFKPAEASGQAVAVKIQFVINFELER
jgi:TonB family protein